MEKGAACKCLCPSMFHISCTKLYVKYGEGMLGYCPIPLFPNSIYIIVLNVLHSARRKLSMKLQPHLPAPPPFLMPSSPSSCPPFPLLSFPFTPLSLHFPVYHTSSLPPIPPYSPLFIALSLTHFHFFPLSYFQHSLLYDILAKLQSCLYFSYLTR